MNAPTPERNACGHLLSEVVTSGEGTAYCVACEREARSADAGETPGEAQSANAEGWARKEMERADEEIKRPISSLLPVPAVPVGDETEALHKARLDALLGEGVPFDYADAQAWEELAREALAHVAGLEFELRLARKKISLREESQIPVVPRGAQAKIERLEAREAALRDALADALDLLEDTADGKTHDGEQAWQDRFAAIHDAAGRPQRHPADSEGAE